MKKTKLDNKGFMLAEIVVVSVFIMAIFGIIYANLLPIMGEYDRREVYDDIDGKYGAYWFKKIIQSNDVKFDDRSRGKSIIDNISSNTYHKFDCNTDVLNNEVRNVCNNLVDKLEVNRRKDNGEEAPDGKPCIYITNFKIGDSDDNLTNTFKDIASEKMGTGIFSGNLSEYVDFLPKYENIYSLNKARYRIIIEYRRKKDNNDYYAYSTIEVRK